MLRATDEEGNVLPEFEKVLDIDIKAAAEAALGKELTQKSSFPWYLTTTGTSGSPQAASASIPSASSQGVLGYIAHSAIEAILNGEQTDLSKGGFRLRADAR